jgi:hypothetical protein
MEPANYYKIMPKKFIGKYHNPAYEKHKIKIPFRMLIVGGSGTMKTNTLLDIIHNMPRTFNSIVICCKSRHEPLYEYLESKAPVDFYDDGVIPPLDDMADMGQVLIVFDDLVLEKDQSDIMDYFIRGRKVGNGVSCIYITQSYFNTPKLIRINCNYLVIKKLSSKRDLNLILSETGDENIKSKYKKAVLEKNKEGLYFLMVDLLLNEDDKNKYRRGLFTYI